MVLSLINRINITILFCNLINVLLCIIHILYYYSTSPNHFSLKFRCETCGIYKSWLEDGVNYDPYAPHHIKNIRKSFQIHDEIRQQLDVLQFNLKLYGFIFYYYYFFCLCASFNYQWKFNNITFKLFKVLALN